MQRQNLRVIVASEHPEVRYFLREVVEREDGAVIVGQAQDYSKALTMARNLRPDAAVIDSNLPHVTGLDITVPLSRIGGLDTAQVISEESPDTRVVLLSNLDTKLVPGYSSGGDAIPVFARKADGSTVPFTLRELREELAPTSEPIFANIEMGPRVAAKQLGLDMTEKAILFGGLGVLGGWFLILTVFLAPVGVVLSAAGAVVALSGLAGKWVARLRSKATAK